MTTLPEDSLHHHDLVGQDIPQVVLRPSRMVGHPHHPPHVQRHACHRAGGRGGGHTLHGPSEGQDGQLKGPGQTFGTFLRKPCVNIERKCQNLCFYYNNFVDDYISKLKLAWCNPVAWCKFRSKFNDAIF